ncbi:IspD/TarI family cytidylyltransferase [Dermabacteraceae bacterium P13101]
MNARLLPLRRPRPAVADTAAIVLAGGSGTRVGAGVNKAFLQLKGRTIAAWSLATMARIERLGPLVFVVRPEDRQQAEAMVRDELPGIKVEVIHGGSTRQESELCALRHLAERIDAGQVRTVLIHDAARPLVSQGLVNAVMHAAAETGGAVPGMPASDLLLNVNGKLAPAGADGQLLRVQTPQGFRAAPLLDAYEAAARDGFNGTDTASCAEEYSDLEVTWVRGEDSNFKITYAQDLLLAQNVVNALGLDR